LTVEREAREDPIHRHDALVEAGALLLGPLEGADPLGLLEDELAEAGLGVEVRHSAPAPHLDEVVEVETEARVEAPLDTVLDRLRVGE
jgi:hypothetical protein